MQIMIAASAGANAALGAFEYLMTQHQLDNPLILLIIW